MEFTPISGDCCAAAAYFDIYLIVIYLLYMSKAKVTTFSATPKDFAMLEAVARYHGLNKSATLASLVRREFWRVFPSGTEKVRPDRGARIEGDR
jgi:hypothetical protein